MVEKEVKEL